MNSPTRPFDPLQPIACWAHLSNFEQAYQWRPSAVIIISSFSRGSRMFEHPPSSSVTKPLHFETRNLPLAAYLVVTQHLHYRGVRAANGRGVFEFDDPQGRGPALEGEFHSGAQCAATLFHSVIKRLRREIDTATARDGAR